MQALLKEIFSAHYRDVYAYLYSLCRDPLLAEDLTAEVFLQAVKSIAGFRGDSDIKTWLFSIARRQWFSHLRRRKRQAPAQALPDFFSDDGQSAEARCFNRELIERIGALLSEEPERTRRIVRMRLDGFSFYEIGRACGVSESSARVIDFRAKTKIRKILKEEGFAGE